MSLAPSYLEKAASEALGRGNRLEAERLLREALAKDPSDYRCTVMIAHLLREKGEALESAGFAEKGARLKPNLVEAYYQLGLSLLDLRNGQAAVQAFGRAVTLRPEVAIFHSCLASAFQMMGRMLEARECLERASKLEPQDLRMRISLANRLLAEDDTYGAALQVRAALSTDPNSVHANLAMAEIAMVDGDGNLCEQHVRKALEKEPDNPHGLALLGLRLSHKGDFENAEIALRRSIDLNPNQGFSYWRLISSKKIGEEDRSLVRLMEEVRDRGRVHGQELSSLLFALGKAYESLGEYERSMACYDEANKAAFQARYGSDQFDEEEYRRKMAAIVELFPSCKTNFGNDSDRPIFIVGMIRSGTTLTEQILSRHPDVAGAGELRFWQRHAETPDLLAEILADPSRAKNLTETYLEDLRSISPTARNVVDKLPGNFKRLGLLAGLFPNAKFIHCMRSPIDNAISIHTTPNRNPSAGKAGVVLAFKQYELMMRHWREILPPDTLLDVRYEELVANPEPTIRKIVSFCNLEWDDACLRPEENTKDILTPSLWQARQPIYRTSVDRWRRFEPWLGEFRELLQVG